MIKSSRISRSFAFLTLLLYTFSAASYADVLSGKIVSIKTLPSGQREVVISTGKQRETVVLDSATAVESRVPAGKLKAGSSIFLSAKAHGGGGGGKGGGHKGLKSPFRGIPKNMQKSMGLPNMPETPEVPGQPKDAVNLPEIPKVPKVPKAPKQKDGEPSDAQPQEGQPQEKERTRVQPQAKEPTEEEKNLYGKASSDKPLLKSTGEAQAPDAIILKKVLSVKNVKLGTQVEVQAPDGSKEEITFSPGTNVSQPFSSDKLKKNMQIQVESLKTEKGKVAQRITVVS